MSQEREYAVAELAGLAYAAIDDDTQWPALAQAYARLLDAGCAGLYLDRGAGSPPLQAATNDAVLRHYPAHRQADPLLEPGLVEHMSRQRRAFLSNELIDDRDLRGSAFYGEFLLPHGNLFHAVGGNFRCEDGALLQLWAWRDKALGCFDDSDRVLADAALQHVLRAAELAARLARLQTRAAHHDAVQDHLHDAVIVLDASNRIVQRNARAVDLLNGAAMENGFHARSLRLPLAEQQRLTQALARARDEPAPQTLRLQRQPPLPALYAVAMPVADQPLSGTVQLFLRDPRWQRLLPEHDLMALYQLTAAQARVCVALVRGESAEDIAQRLDVRVATVRSQIKDAMEKVGLHRQSDLVRHLSLALPALACANVPA